MNLTDKYVFRPYSNDFPELFTKEKARLQSKLGTDITIEHIGSTAVPGLGGKGVIDILIIAPKTDWQSISSKLTSFGYDYKKKDADREEDKLFFMAHIPDKELGDRIYHVHLSYPGSSEIHNSIGFRDFLRSNPSKLKEYEEIKKSAAKAAQNLTTKDEMRDTYGKIKQDFIEKTILLFPGDSVNNQK